MGLPGDVIAKLCRGGAVKAEAGGAENVNAAPNSAVFCLGDFWRNAKPGVYQLGTYDFAWANFEGKAIVVRVGQGSYANH